MVFSIAVSGMSYARDPIRANVMLKSDNLVLGIRSRPTTYHHRASREVRRKHARQPRLISYSIDSALFSFSASGGTLRRLVVWIAAVCLSLFTLWFARVHGIAMTEPKDEEGYELLQGRSSSDDVQVGMIGDDEAKRGFT
jgi:hypothetical protein